MSDGTRHRIIIRLVRVTIPLHAFGFVALLRLAKVHRTGIEIE